jgi:hypothetical protein
MATREVARSEKRGSTPVASPVPPSTLSVYGIDEDGRHEGKIVERATGRVMWHVRGSEGYVREHMQPMQLAFQRQDRECWLAAHPEPEPTWVKRWERKREASDQLADMLHQTIANDDDPDFTPQHWRDRNLNARTGERLAPRLQQRLKRFGRFAEILAAPRARIERSRWCDMPGTSNTAAHSSACCCQDCLEVAR